MGSPGRRQDIGGAATDPNPTGLVFISALSTDQAVSQGDSVLLSNWKPFCITVPHILLHAPNTHTVLSLSPRRRHAVLSPVPLMCHAVPLQLPELACPEATAGYARLLLVGAQALLHLCAGTQARRGACGLTLRGKGAQSRARIWAPHARGMR